MMDCFANSLTNGNHILENPEKSWNKAVIKNMSLKNRKMSWNVVDFQFWIYVITM